MIRAETKRDTQSGYGSKSSSQHEKLLGSLLFNDLRELFSGAL